MQRSEQMLQSRDVLAAAQSDPERLVETTDPDERERFAQEAQRMADRHDPSDAV